MKFVYKSSRKMSEEVASNESSFQASDSDEVFGSPCFNYSDCEFCSERRKNKTSYQGSPAQTSYHTALERISDSAHTSPGRYRNNIYNVPYYGAVDTMPLLTTAAGEQRKSDSDSSDSLGTADLSSAAVLLTLDKMQSQKNKPQTNKQSSLVTIFSVWNTTMGSSLLAMAWGVDRAGLAVALVLLVLMAALCLYTAYLLLAVNKHHGGETCEVPALCRILLGRWAERVAHVFSLLVLIGANIVYWILISNFLYFTVIYFVDLYNPNGPPHNATIFCPNGIEENTSLITPPLIMDEAGPPYWRLHTSVPVYVALIVFPLLNFRSATFFTKFNSLGTLSVAYLMIFVSVKLYSWGVNTSALLETPRKWQDAAALSGMLALSFYIHNIIITIMNSNQRQDRNGRDLSIAFLLVTLTYMLVGAGFYICFPLLKTCIADNILNNFEMHDVMTVVARILLLFQVITVYPLVAFMLREEAILLLPMRKTWKELKSTTVGINAVIVTVCILFACFCPNIGTIIRYTGAVSGLVHIFTLPSLLYVRSLKIRDQLTRTKCILFSVIIALGVVNFLMQFFIS